MANKDLYNEGFTQFENRMNEYNASADYYKIAESMITDLARKAYQSARNVSGIAEAYFLLCSSEEYGIEVANTWLNRAA